MSTFDDDFETFEEAASTCKGYDDEAINYQTFHAAREVIQGRAAFERDGVLFNDPAPRAPIANALSRSLAQMGSIRVLDVGGGLGSSYWQNIITLDAKQLHWTIIERPDLVRLAPQLPSHPINYSDDLAGALELDWDVILLSSVLQYLPDPHDLLQKINVSRHHKVIVDRTPVHHDVNDVICVQHTPAHIYEAAYPAWIFGQGSLEASLPGYSVTERFPGIEPPMRTSLGMTFSWQGFVATA